MKSPIIAILRDILKHECVPISTHTQEVNQSYADGYNKAIEDVIAIIHQDDRQED